MRNGRVWSCRSLEHLIKSKHHSLIRNKTSYSSRYLALLTLPHFPPTHSLIIHPANLTSLHTFSPSSINSFHLSAPTHVTSSYFLSSLVSLSTTPFHLNPAPPHHAELRLITSPQPQARLTPCTTDSSEACHPCSHQASKQHTSNST